MSSLCGPTMAEKPDRPRSSRSRAVSSTDRRRLALIQASLFGFLARRCGHPPRSRPGARSRRELSHGADDSGWPGMADEEDFAPLARVISASAMHFGWTNGAGGIELEEVARLRRGAHCLGDAVGGEDHRLPGLREFRRAPRRRTAPLPSRHRRHGGCGRSRGAHRRGRRTFQGKLGPMWIARSTPAQKPRGSKGGCRGCLASGRIKLDFTERAAARIMERTFSSLHPVNKQPNRVLEDLSRSISRLSDAKVKCVRYFDH